MQNVCTPNETKSSRKRRITSNDDNSPINSQKDEDTSEKLDLSSNNSGLNAGVLPKIPRKKSEEQAFQITFRNYPKDILTMKEAGTVKEFIYKKIRRVKIDNLPMLDNVTLGATLSGSIAIVTHNERIRNELRQIVEKVDIKPSTTHRERGINHLTLISVKDFKPAKTISVTGYRGLSYFPLDFINSQIEKSFSEQPGYLWSNNSRAMFTVSERTWQRISTAHPPLTSHTWEGDFVLHAVEVAAQQQTPSEVAEAAARIELLIKQCQIRTRNFFESRGLIKREEPTTDEPTIEPTMNE